MKRVVLVVAVAAVCSVALFALSRSKGPKMKKHTTLVRSEEVESQLAATRAAQKRLLESIASGKSIEGMSAKTIKERLERFEATQGRRDALQAKVDSGVDMVEVTREEEILKWKHSITAELIYSVGVLFWAVILGVVAYMTFIEHRGKGIAAGVLVFLVAMFSVMVAPYRLVREEDAVRYALLRIPLATLFYCGMEFMSRKYRGSKKEVTAAQKENTR